MRGCLTFLLLLSFFEFSHHQQQQHLDNSLDSSSGQTKKDIVSKKLNSKKLKKESKKLRKQNAEVEVSAQPFIPLLPAVDSVAVIPARTRLRQDLLKNYSKDVHPVINHTHTVKVDVGLALIHLDLDEKKSILEVDAWLRLNWKDEFLSWNSSEYEGLKTIHFGLNDIWRPDIELYNSATGGAGNRDYGNTHFLVFESGEVLWVPPAKFKAFCKVGLQMWPLEAQNCKLKFGSWTSHGDQIGLGLYKNMSSVELLNFYTDNTEWDILTTVAVMSTAKYECCPESYPDVTFSFFIQRNSAFYRCAIILPCLVTMMVVVASFLLPPDAGEKLVVNSACFIVCILYLLYFLTVLPAMSDQIPLIVLFYSNTAALVGIALVLNICCLTMSRAKRYSSPPRVVRQLFSGCLGKVLCLGHYYHQVSPTHHRLTVELDSVSDNPESEQSCSQSQNVESLKQAEWLLVAAGVERLFFLVYTCAFGIVSSAYI